MRALSLVPFTILLAACSSTSEKSQKTTAADRIPQLDRVDSVLRPWLKARCVVTSPRPCLWLDRACEICRAPRDQL